MPRENLSRREFLALLGVASAVEILGCSSPTGEEPPSPPPGSLDHVIVVTMENRSFDHLLGWLPGAAGRQAGLSYVDPLGVARPTHRLTDFQGCEFPDPDHSYSGGRVQYNGGACDGWLRKRLDIYPIGYYVAGDLPFLGQAAPQWLVLDRYFTAMMGPTFPNRVISLAAQTDRIENTFVPCTLPTIWDRLMTAGLTGKNYGAGAVSSSLWGGRYASLIHSMTAFFSDASAGDLANVAFVDPNFFDNYSSSYHPPGDIRNAEAFLGSIYNAVTSSPAWKKSLLVITFDEWGGFFDHVPPGVAPLPALERDAGNLDGLRGFRIPTLLISPFVKRGTVSSKVYDHASVLRLIESRWNLEPLTVRDSGANNLMDELDLTIPVAPAPVIDVPGGPFGRHCA